MTPSNDLSELQLATMRVLWDRGEASAAEVQKALQKSRGLAITTVGTILTRLEKRGLVSHRAEGRSFLYRAVVSEAAARRSSLRSLLQNFFEGDAGALVSHLVSDTAMSDQDLAEMRKLIGSARSSRRQKGKP